MKTNMSRCEAQGNNISTCEAYCALYKKTEHGANVISDLTRRSLQTKHFWLVRITPTTNTWRRISGNYSDNWYEMREAALKRKKQINVLKLVCACIWWQQGVRGFRKGGGWGVAGWCMLICHWTKLWVSHVGDVQGVDVMGSCCGAAQSEGCENGRPTTSFINTTPGDSCHIAMATSATYLMQCLFILLVQLSSAGLILLYDSSANSALGGLNERLLRTKPVKSDWLCDNYTFKTMLHS